MYNFIVKFGEILDIFKEFAGNRDKLTRFPALFHANKSANSTSLCTLDE